MSRTPISLSSFLPAHLSSVNPCCSTPDLLFSCPLVSMFYGAPVCLFTLLPISPCFPISLPTCHPVFQYPCLPLHLFTFLPIFPIALSTCASVHLSSCHLFYLSTCLVAYLFQCFMVFLFTCIPMALATSQVISPCIYLPVFFSSTPVFLSCLSVHLCTCTPVSSF